MKRLKRLLKKKEPKPETQQPFVAVIDDWGALCIYNGMPSVDVRILQESGTGRKKVAFFFEIARRILNRLLHGNERS